MPANDDDPDLESQMRRRREALREWLGDDAAFEEIERIREEAEVMARAIWARQQFGRKPEEWDALADYEKAFPRMLAQAAAEALAEHRKRRGE